MDDYLCLTLLSALGESESEFKARLSAFWTRMLREKPVIFEKVYAEAAACDAHGDQLGRRYLIEADIAEGLAADLAVARIEHIPIDPNEVYSKFEAAPPEWFWIEH